MRRMEYLGVFCNVFFYLLVGSRPPGGSSDLNVEVEWMMITVILEPVCVFTH